MSRNPNVFAIGVAVAGLIVSAETIRRVLRLKKSSKQDSRPVVHHIPSPQQVEPPPPGLRPYEVFISFRGEDTRNNFVSHLHSALKDRGIRTYFDETNLQTGQTIGPELMKAIEESSIVIVVLSINYGSSTWCLNELVKIMECKKNWETGVFPIFYHVETSDVRYQKNSFFEAFSNHEVNFKNNIEMVNKWRKALEQVANIKGEDISGKNEASCIKKIADNILKKLPVKATEFRKSLVGIESPISKIKKMVFGKPNDVRFIGLWGMGGIGKTTIAKAIFEDCKNKFQGSCFLKDGRQNKNRLEDLQKKLLSNVLNTKFGDIYDVDEGSSKINKKRLQSKKVVLIIDNVDDKEQLDALARHSGWFGRGSRIIITTRDVHLLSEDHITKYNVQKLPQNEALRLFCSHAFKNDHPHEDFEEFSLEVLRYADGLPLALRVLGCHLFNRNKYFWEVALKKLKEISKDKIFSILMISFEGLDDFQKDIFLDISCFFIGYPKDGVEERLGSLGLYPKEGIDVLIQKSLIHISYNDIEMHDLLQEMGWYIVRQRSNGDIRKYSHLWLKEDIEHVLSDITVPCEAERIYIPSDIKLELGWEQAFRNKNKLRFLQIDRDNFLGEEDANVSQSIGELDNTLRLLSWEYYPGKSLPESFHPINLVQLHMQYSRIKETPDFSDMPNLEVLNLCLSCRLVYVHPSIGDHMKLKHIDLNNCKSLEEFPRINQMKSLESLSLSDTSLRNFPEIYGNLDSLKKLEFFRTPINGLPTSIVGNATRLEKLSFECFRTYGDCPNILKASSMSSSDDDDESDWVSITRDPKDCEPYADKQFISLEVIGGSFPGIVELRINYTAIVRTLDFSHLPYLQDLNLSDSEELVEIHSSLGVHKKIKFIYLSNCSKLEKFPIIDDMDSLKVLNLLDTRLQCFPEIYGKLDSLRNLELRGTPINGLPSSIVGTATSLQKLELACHRPFEEGFKSLEVVAKSFPGLVCLEITGSGIVQTMDFSHLPYLEKLNLSFSEELAEVHASIGVHKRIKYINLKNCSKLAHFPKICDMNSLEHLDLSYTGLQSFPEIYGNMDSLKTLELRETLIQGLPTSILGNAIGLQKLELACHRPFSGEFTSLALVAKSFPGLVSLEIMGSGIVRTCDFSLMPYLEKLNLSDSEELVEVHASLGVHERIRSINLKNCSNLVEFPKICDVLYLEDLNLSYTRLQNFPEMEGNVGIETLNLDGTEITTLPWSIGCATELKIISMRCCENLLTLPVSIIGLEIQKVSISSGALKYFKESIDDESAVSKEVELDSLQMKRREQLIGSEGISQLSCGEINFSYCTSLEDLPDFLLSRAPNLIIMECPKLTSWICFKLGDILDKYQHLCHLQLHQTDDIVAFSESEVMSNMLRNREKFFEVYVAGREIPSWFQYQFSTSSVTMFLPPLSEWYTDKFRGFVLSGINANVVHPYAMSISCYSHDHHVRCCCPEDVHLLVVHIPVDSIRMHMDLWVRYITRTIAQLSSRSLGIEMVETSPRWGLSLVYSEGEAIELDPHQLMIITHNDNNMFRINIAEDKDVIEELYCSENLISWASLQQQTHSEKAGTSDMAEDSLLSDNLKME